MVIKGVFSPKKAAFSDNKRIVRGVIRKHNVLPTVHPIVLPTQKNKRKVQGKAAATLHQITAFLAAV
jgi:hypothetical protein